nr:sensor histidine kinase [Treponema sp.]
YEINKTYDKSLIGISFWKVDLNKSIYFSIKNNDSGQDCILKISDDEHYDIYSPANKPINLDYKILSFEVTNDGILFIDLKKNANSNRKLISFNPSSNQFEILIDFHGYEYWGNLSMCYSSVNDVLYAESYGPGLIINNQEVLYDSGFYIFKRIDGIFSRQGMERSFSLANWLVTNARVAFTQKGQLNYRKFLDWLYYYCDYGEKTFVYENSQGTFTDEEAFKRFVEDGIYRDDSILLSQHLKKVRNGEILEETALSCVEKSPKSYPLHIEYQPYTAWLVKTLDGIWMFKDTSIQTLDEDGSYLWKTSFFTPYLIEDSKGDYPELYNRPLESVRIDALEDNLPAIREIYGSLIYKDKDSPFYCLYRDSNLLKFNSLQEAEAAAKKLLNGKKVKIPKKDFDTTFYLLILAILVIILLSIFIIIILSRKFSQHLSKKDKRFIFKIQEEERSKLSRDIHDSVVQNIRAIRLDAEMINVNPDQQAQKQKVIDEMTEVISLLRNICYNFRPAELSVQSEQTELISIIDTLCQQFIARTKIPCQIQIQKDFMAPKMDTERSTNIVRVVQEALSNIEKHSYATKVQILIKTQGEEDNKSLVIFIIDDGIGCDVNKLGRSKMNFGIRNMKERIAVAGGQIEFFSTPNEGLSVQLKIPYEVKD